MSRRLTWIGGMVLALLTGSLFLLRGPEKTIVRAGLQTGLAQTGNFARVTGPVDLLFPRDHGAHGDTQTEWWYYTGNLDGANGERYGFQLTFFRRALQSADLRQERESSWGVEQVYLAHFTLTDVRNRRFHAFERLERGAAGLAGAVGVGGLRVWLRDWKVEQTGTDSYRLTAAEEGLRLELDLNAAKGIVLQGDRGYSRKGPQPGNASMYFSQTRLEAVGSVEIDGQRVAVQGLSWMDHEFSTSALSPGQVGWDWFSIQLDDGSEIMVYSIRREDGTIDSFSAGTWVGVDGSTRLLSAGDFQITVEDTWRSEQSGGTYPAAWTLTIPGEELTLRIRPVLADQELNLSFIYWEGAVDVEGVRNGVKVNGRGYVELTGYAQSLEGRF